jgi:hypothetical protein
VKIGKREIMSLRETLHILKRIFRIARRVVRANRHKAYAFRHQHTGVRNHAVDHRFDIGAMIADENDDRAFFARNFIQCVSLAVGGRKPKLRRRRIENDRCSCCRHIAPACREDKLADRIATRRTLSSLAVATLMLLSAPSWEGQ